jgi:Type II CAAX prenyl endopeptidase Rce1-like
MTYFAAVRHPWPSLVFLVPILAAYEVGAARLAGPSGESLRAGIDLWVRKWLNDYGAGPPALIPLTVVALLAGWSAWRWKERPEHLFATVFGIALEGAVFGLGLWTLCLNAPAILEKCGLPTLAAGVPDARVITFLGVGVYEEFAFRLIGFAWLAWLLRVAFLPGVAAIPMAIVASSAAFALAHHFVQTDPFVPAVFMTRMLAGAYCALLFWWRGLGVAVGAHIVYDLIVGLPRG